MAITKSNLAQITGRLGVLRCATGRVGAVARSYELKLNAGVVEAPITVVEGVNDMLDIGTYVLTDYNFQVPAGDYGTNMAAVASAIQLEWERMVDALGGPSGAPAVNVILDPTADPPIAFQFFTGIGPLFELLAASGTHHHQSLYRSIGFISNTGLTGNVSSQQDPAASIQIVRNYNDWIDATIQEFRELALTIPPGAYYLQELAEVIHQQWVAEGAPNEPGTSVLYNPTTAHYEFRTANAHTLLTGTGANLARSLWTTIGFNIGSNSTQATFHESDNVVENPDAPSGEFIWNRPLPQDGNPDDTAGTWSTGRE